MSRQTALYLLYLYLDRWVVLIFSKVRWLDKKHQTRCSVLHALEDESSSKHIQEFLNNTDMWYVFFLREHPRKWIAALILLFIFVFVVMLFVVTIIGYSILSFVLLFYWQSQIIDKKNHTLISNHEEHVPLSKSLILSSRCIWRVICITYILTSSKYTCVKCKTITEIPHHSQTFTRSILQTFLQNIHKLITCYTVY